MSFEIVIGCPLLLGRAPLRLMEPTRFDYLTPAHDEICKLVSAHQLGKVLSLRKTMLRDSQKNDKL